MKTLHSLLKILFAALFACCGSAMAAGVDLVGDDTDLFTTNPNIPAQVPNVLFVIDDTASWNSASNGWGAAGALSAVCTAAGFPYGGGQIKQGDAELCAIYAAIGKLSQGVNVGFMKMNTKNQGAYVRFPMQSMTSNGIANFQTVLKSIDVNAPLENTGSTATYEDKMNDVFRYFNSLGTFTQNAASTLADANGYTDGNKNNFKFIAGQNGDTCGYDYIIFIGNTFPNTPAWTAYPAAGGAADLITAANLLGDPSITFGTNNADLVPVQNTGSNADIWSKFMFKYGVHIPSIDPVTGLDRGLYRHVTTYTINVCSYSATGVDTCPTDKPGGASQTTLLKSMASVSNGKYFSASNLSQIDTALEQIFAEVQAVNSVFAATTLPVSINVRGTNLNQVYIGVFRPDSLASPRWLGNLKQYQLGVNSTTGALQLVDKNLTQAVNLNTGFISNSATSFWTTAYDADPITSGTQGFWSFRGPPLGTYPTTDVGKDQDAPDGDLVEKGGVAERIRVLYPSPDSAGQVRNIYTCTDVTAGTCTAGRLLSETPFARTNTAGVTDAALGTYSSVPVNTLTASGTTATATTVGPHDFTSSPPKVTIAGAVPNLFNGSFDVTVTGLTTFTYTLPSAPDTTHAYATQPGYTLVPGADKVTVTGATPADYNVANADISSVFGNANQFSYAIGSSPTSAATGYSVTGIRRVQVSGGTSNLQWSSTTNLGTVTLANHGYTSGNVVITGATDNAFNTTGTPITVVSPSQFTYPIYSTPAGGTTTTGIATPAGGIPSGWTSGTVVQVSGASGNFNTPTGGSSITVSGNTFTYNASGTVSGNATGTMFASRVVAADTSTWTLASSALVTSSVNQGSTWNVTTVDSAACGSTTCLRFTITQGKLTTSGNTLRKLVTSPGDNIQINGTSCSFRDSGNTTRSCLNTNMAVVNVVYSCNSSAADTSTLVAAATTSYQNFSTPGGCANGNIYVDVTAPGNNGVKASPSPSINSVTMGYTGSNAIASAIRFTLSAGQYNGQFLRRLQAGDLISMNSSCTYTVSGSANFCTPNPTSSPAGTLAVVAVVGNSDITTSVVGPNTPSSINGTVTVDIAPSNIQGATAVSTPTGTTMTWTGQSVGTSMSLTSITAGGLTVNAAGTVYASVSGDLTTKVSSITNQSQATGTITASNSTTPATGERELLIDWVRGMDNKLNPTDENKNTILTDVRASVHGDVLHSRPAVINYNRYGNDNDVYVFYGANDGMFHAVKGGQASDGGNEQWGFIAPEHFKQLKRLRDQLPVISSSNPKGYFFDGPIGVYTLDANSDGKLTTGTSGDKVYLYTAMRRGGRMIYAFDVTDPTAPKLLWKKGCTQPTGTGTTGGCDAGWDNVGQTWSQPQVVYLRAYPTTPVLIFGAGYDAPAEDFQPCYVTAYDSTSVTGKTGLTPPTPMSGANCPPSGGGSSTQNRTMGQGVFIVDAITGAVLWSAGPSTASPTMSVSGMNYSITADLAIMRNRTNTAARTLTPGIENVPTGYMDRIYAPDTGGNVWRFDVADASPANWVVLKLAGISTASAISTTTGSPAAANMRKFEFQPDVVYSSNPTTNQLYDAVLLGSGDREHPFDMVVNNRFYMIRDVNTGTLAPADITTPNSPPAVITESNLYDITDGCLQQASLCSGVTQSEAQGLLDAAKGWKFLFAPTNVGEKTISSATTAASTVIFNTNQPKQDTVTGTLGQCTSDLGTARQYGLNFQTGNSQNIFNALPTQYVPTSGLGRYATFAGGGFLPTPVPVVVQIDGKYYQTVIAGVQTTNPGGLKLQSRLRTYWYRKTD